MFEAASPRFQIVMPGKARCISCARAVGALPEAFGHWMMVFMRYKRWIERGVLWKVLMRLQKVGALKVSVTFMDSSVIRAHRHAAGARKKGAAKP